MKISYILLLLFLLTGRTACLGQFVEWNKELINYNSEQYLNNSSQEVNRIFSIQLTGGDILIVQNNTITLEEEYMKFGTRYDSVLFIRVNPAGQVVWKHSMEYTGRGKIYAASATQDSGFVCCGVQSTFLSLFKFDKIGNLQTLKQWPKPLQKMYPCNITVGPDNNYYMLTAEFYYKDCTVPSVFYHETIYDVFYNLIKIDKSGNIKWIKASGSDIVQSPDWQLLSNCDTLDIRNIPLYTMIDALGGTINLVNSRPYYYNPDYGYSLREIYLQKFDTNGNALVNKTLIDSLSPAKHISEEVEVFYTFSLHENMSRTGNGYLFSFYGGYIPDIPPVNNDSTYEVYYHQTFDANGNKIDSIVQKTTKYWFDLSPRDYAEVPALKDDNGNYWSIQNKSLENSANSEGSLILCQLNSLFRITSEVYFSEYFPDARLTQRKIYTAPDGGMLLVYTKNYRNDVGLGDYGEGICIAKIGQKGNSIQYDIYIDNNRNGIKDAGDLTFSDALLQVSHHQHSEESPYSQGQFIYNADTGTYTSRLVSYDQRLYYYDIIPPIATTTFNTYGKRDTIEFRLVTKPNIQDLQVSIMPTSSSRPGFESYYTLLLQNAGTDTTHDILLKFLKDPRQTIIYADPSYTIVDDTLIWAIEYREPFFSFPFFVICKNNTPPGLNQGDTLVLQAWILPLERDTAKTDNYFQLNQAVTNSNDPNDKSEAHGEGITTSQLTQQDYLYYTIRFQNTGNDVAYNVVIKDTLSELLDWGTFEMMQHSSHGYKLEVKDNRYITWTLYNIYLVDSATSERGSLGYVSFRIKPKAGLSTSDVIENRASIIFDFNQPIVTNTVTTRILQERVTLVNHPEIKSIKLYPSPTDSRFTMDIDILSQRNLNLTITDISGREVYATTISGYTGKNTIQLDISGQPNGIYLIQLNDEAQNFYYGKVIKQ